MKHVWHVDVADNKHAINMYEMKQRAYRAFTQNVQINPRDSAENERECRIRVV